MKFLNRLFLLGTALAVGLSFTSCSDDDETIPQGIVVTVDNAANSVLDTTSVITGRVTSSEGLKNVKFYLNVVKDKNVELVDAVTTFKDKNSFSFRIEIAQIKDHFKAITGEATVADFIVVAIDKKDEMGTKTVPVSLTKNNLEKAEEFTISNPKDPKSKYGVTYDQDTKTEAVLKGNFVVLTKAAFDAIKTKAAIKTAFTDGEPVTSLNVAHNNSAKAYFIVLDGDVYRLMQTVKVDAATAGDHKITISAVK